MIGPGEVRAALATYGADVDRAAYRLAVGLSGGDTSGGYLLHLKQTLVDAFGEAVAGAALLTREGWEQAVAEEEAWARAEDAAERSREERAL